MFDVFKKYKKVFWGSLFEEKLQCSFSALSRIRCLQECLQNDTNTDTCNYAASLFFYHIHKQSSLSFALTLNNGAQSPPLHHTHQHTHTLKEYQYKPINECGKGETVNVEI